MSKALAQRGKIDLFTSASNVNPKDIAAIEEAIKALKVVKISNVAEGIEVGARKLIRTDPDTFMFTIEHYDFEAPDHYYGTFHRARKYVDEKKTKVVIIETEIEVTLHRNDVQRTVNVA